MQNVEKGTNKVKTAMTHAVSLIFDVVYSVIGRKGFAGMENGWSSRRYVTGFGLNGGGCGQLAMCLCVCVCPYDECGEAGAPVFVGILFYVCSRVHPFLNGESMQARQIGLLSLHTCCSTWGSEFSMSATIICFVRHSQFFKFIALSSFTIQTRCGSAFSVLTCLFNRQCTSLFRSSQPEVTGVKSCTYPIYPPLSTLFILAIPLLQH